MQTKNIQDLFTPFLHHASEKCKGESTWVKREENAQQKQM